MLPVSSPAMPGSCVYTGNSEGGMTVCGALQLIPSLEIALPRYAVDVNSFSTLTITNSLWEGSYLMSIEAWLIKFVAWLGSGVQVTGSVDSSMNVCRLGWPATNKESSVYHIINFPF